jgi:hypothetical protein
MKSFDVVDREQSTLHFLGHALRLRSKYPPAEPEALRVAGPLKGALPATQVKTTSRNSAAAVMAFTSNAARVQAPTVRYSKDDDALPELSNFYCHPGIAGGLPFALADG